MSAPRVRVLPGSEGPRLLAALHGHMHPELPPEPPEPGATCLVLESAGVPAAWLSGELVPGLSGGPGRTGIVGHYEALDPDAGVTLLRHATFQLMQAGAARVLGPMNGSTWARYRWMLPPDGGVTEAPFPTEPVNPPAYPEQFRAVGFVPASRYESRIVRALPACRPGAAALACRLAGRGIRTRPLDGRRLDEEFTRMLDLGGRVFAGSPYYRAVEPTRIRALYAPLLARLDPEFVRLAQDEDGRLRGFALAFPDAARGRAVIKTLAAEPAYPGLGALLSDEVHDLAYRKGYGSVIHALMRSDNDSVRLSRRYGSEPFRRYALYQWTPPARM